MSAAWSLWEKADSGRQCANIRFVSTRPSSASLIFRQLSRRPATLVQVFIWRIGGLLEFDARRAVQRLTIQSIAFQCAITRTGSFLCWGVKNAIDFNDIVIKQTPHLKHGSWWVRWPSPKFGLYFADERRDAVQVGYVDCNADAILKSCALRLGNEFQIQESLTNARLVSIDQFIGGRIDALHPGNKNKVAGPRANAPGIGPSADCARRIKCLDVGW